MKNRKINGVKVYAPTSRAKLINFAFENNSILVAVNAEKILHATDESRNIINRNVGYPDGFGAIIALKKSGLSSVTKIPGCELWLDIIRLYHKNKRFYLVGSKDSVIEQTVTQLKNDYCDIQIVNYRNGYLKTEDDVQCLIEDIVEKKPDVVFVAMGSPKQEYLMERLSKHHPALYQGLGGSFDVYTGKVKRAPNWWVKNNLEWLYRLVQEPTRIKRQVHLFRFLFLLFIGRFN